MLLELGVAVGGGILNAIAGSAENDQIEAQKQRTLAYLNENIIDSGELNDMLRDINSMFNSRLVSTLNSTAIRSRGISNNNIVKGSASAELEGQRINTLSTTRMKVLEANRTTRAQMSGVEATMGPKSNFFGNFTTGALTAAPIGMELSKLFKPAEDVVAGVIDGGPDTSVSSTPISSSGGDATSRRFSGNYDGPSYKSPNEPIITDPIEEWKQNWLEKKNRLGKL